MKEKIYTIPLSEAFEQNSECPFCSLYDELEKKAVEYALGPSYMEPDSRILTNDKGFCREHYKRMYDENNRLGLALMLSSHYDEILKKYDSWYEDKNAHRHSIFSGSGKEKVLREAEKLEGSCFICDKISSDMDKFYDTFVYMWKREADFRDKAVNSKGFCIKHFDKIMAVAEKKLSRKEFTEFLNIMYEKQVGELKRVRGELDWFIKKFDYRFKEEPWGEAKSALKRSIIKIASLNAEYDN